MENLWKSSDAKAAIAQHAKKGIGEDLALRVYTTRLLGGEPRLVLHGGGNTSVKTRMADITGSEIDVLCVKGSGWDMGTIEAPGLPAVRLAPLKELHGLQALSDEDMVNVQRSNLLDSKSPNPSVETLLHAFLPHKFIDHTHSNAVLALTDQPGGDPADPERPEVDSLQERRPRSGAALRIRVPHQPGHPGLRRRQGDRALQPAGPGDARPRDPHQEPAVRDACPRGRQARRF